MAKFVRYACVCSVVSDSLGSMVCSLPGFSTHGIFQARILEWVALFSSRLIFLTQGSKKLLHILHWQVNSLLLYYLGSSSFKTFFFFDT